MREAFMFTVILLPVATGILVPFLPFKKRSYREIFLEGFVILNSILVWELLTKWPEQAFTLAKFTGNLTITFKIDGMGMVFAGLIAALWPFATLYAFEYMKEEANEKTFFLFYTMTYGVIMGIAMAGNLLTMYFFYELLTLVTVPLVMHTLTREAILASRKYLYYSLGGAAFAFVGMIFVILFGSTTDFILGGVLDLSKIGDRGNILLLIYVIAFMGFGVKAAVCPFNSWLPAASVAPTPVTALLHAVAVVNSGAFAMMRLTYYSFGTAFLKGTWAQNAVMAAALLTILYGSSRAVKETHMKRRLAYSTISNLSYIVFGITLMTPLGMVAALAHMVFHGVIKISAFFCVGAVTHQTGKLYVHELDGLGARMRGVFFVFTVSALSLMGVPLLAGFVSKWYLARAAVESATPLAYGGIVCLLVSALLTAIYMLTMVVRAFFPGEDFGGKEKGGANEERNGRENEEINGGVNEKVNGGVNEEINGEMNEETNEETGEVANEEVMDPNWKMMFPLAIFTVFMVVFGVYSSPVISFLKAVAEGIY